MSAGSLRSLSAPSASGHRRIGRPIVVLLVILFASLGALPAYAHATLIDTDPADGARLDQAPAVVTLSFNEPVSVVPEAMVLFSHDEPPLPLTASAFDKIVTIVMPDLAMDRRYTVSWSIISNDGHPVSGTLSFEVGDPPEAAVTQPSQPAGSPLVAGAHALTTGVWYAALLLVAGLLAFQVLCARRSARPTGPSLMRLTGIGALVGSVAVLLLLPLQALRVAESTPGGAAPWSSLIGWRPVLTAGMTCAGLMVTALLAGCGRIVPALAAAAVALASPLGTGHSAAVGPVWLMVIGDLVHLAAGAIWAGGVLGLALHLRATQAAGASAGDHFGKSVDDGSGIRDAARVTQRFSTAAAAALVAVGLSGTTMAVLIVPTWGALTGTGYGRLLLVKIGVVALVVALGAWNRFRLIPTLERAGSDCCGTLLRVVRAEAVLLAAVALLTGVLVNQSPSGPARIDSSSTVADAAADGTVTGEGDGLVVRGNLTPMPDGSSQLRFTAYDANDVQVHPIEPPTVTTHLPAQNLGPTRYESRDSPTDLHGTYLVDLMTPVPGRWEVLIGIRLSTFDQQTVRLEMAL